TGAPETSARGRESGTKNGSGTMHGRRRELEAVPASVTEGGGAGYGEILRRYLQIYFIHSRGAQKGAWAAL
ncbi:MAG TPA: hypothetical protein VEN30_16775, partial [Paraburkholderia sp.]|nr:hypothetical protein [Paraburkholderia sp.]